MPTFPAWTLEEVATPNAKTIAEVCGFLRIEPALTIKSLVVMTDSGPALALVRGDHQLHERKLQRVLGAFRPAHQEEIVAATGGEAGFGKVEARNVSLELCVVLFVDFGLGKWILASGLVHAFVLGV